MNTSNRKNIIILAFALIVVMLGYGMVIPLFPFYIEKLGAGGSQLGLLIATSALLELLFGPIWGSVSDRIGRKPILLLGLLGYALSSLLFGLSTELWMLFASRALSGVLSSATTARRWGWASFSARGPVGGWGAISSHCLFSSPPVHRSWRWCWPPCGFPSRCPPRHASRRAR